MTRHFTSAPFMLPLLRNQSLVPLATTTDSTDLQGSLNRTGSLWWELIVDHEQSFAIALGVRLEPIDGGPGCGAGGFVACVQ